MRLVLGGDFGEQKKKRIRRHAKLICYMLMENLLLNYNPMISMETHISWAGAVGVQVSHQVNRH